MAANLLQCSRSSLQLWCLRRPNATLRGPCSNAWVLFRSPTSKAATLLQLPVRNLSAQLGQQLASLRVVVHQRHSARRHSDGIHTLIHRCLCPHPWRRQTKLDTDALVTHVAPLDVSLCALRVKRCDMYASRSCFRMIATFNNNCFDRANWWTVDACTCRLITDNLKFLENSL